MAKKSKTPSGTPSNLLQLRAPLVYVLAFKATAQKRGITVAQAGVEAVKLWLDREKAPISPIPPQEAKLTK